MYKIPFSMQLQQEDLWCWAAVTASVSRSYDPHSSWHQCVIASHCLNKRHCCSQSGTCNHAYRLDHPLNATNNLRKKTAGPIPFVEVQQEIDGDRPVCCHIDWGLDQWGTKKGHFVVISGYDLQAADVFVNDSRGGCGPIPYQALLNGYGTADGIWDYTYYTKP